MPLAATGVIEFRKANPTYDGRGVLIGILDSGIDPGIPGLSVTSTGERKILDLRDFSGEGEVKLEKAAPSGDTVVIAGKRLGGFSRVRTTNAAGPWYVGTIAELPLGEMPASDLNGNRNDTDTLPIVVTRASDGWVLFIDGNGNGSLGDERPVHDYLIAREVFAWSTGKATPNLTLAANFRDNRGVPSLDLYFDTSAHGSHVAGIAAAHDMYGVKGFDGVAPGAQLLGLKIANDAQGGISTTGSMLRAVDYAITFAHQRRMPLVLNMSFGVGNEAEGKARIDQLIDSVLQAHPDVVFTISAGNDGPGLSTMGFPGSANRALTVGATFPAVMLGAVTKPASEREAHAHPVLLPDGRHFLYLRGLPPGMRTVVVGDLNAAPEAQSTSPVVTTDYGVAVTQASAGGPPLVLFLRNDTLLAQAFDMAALALTGSPVTVMEQVAGIPNGALGLFSVSKNGTLVYRTVTGSNRQLTWFNRQGDIVGRPGERAPYGTMKVSPDGTKAVVVQNDPRQAGNADLWIVDLTSGASTRFTFDPGFDGQPVWSPDGRFIAWMAQRNNQMGLYRKAADGTGTDELLAAPKDFTNLTDWTHNGFLIFTIGGDVQALPVTPDASGNRTPIPVIQSPANERGAYVSPDNRWIAYMSSETGRDEIYVQPFSVGGQASGKWMVSRGTRGMARWRADSKELMFVNGDGAVVAVDVAAGPAFQASAPKKLFQMPLDLLSNQNVGTLADAPRDMQRVLMVMPVQESAQRELAVVLNWQAGLRK